MNMFTADQDKRKEAIRRLKSCNVIGEDVHLLALADGLERIYFKYRIKWLADFLKPQAGQDGSAA